MNTPLSPFRSGPKAASKPSRQKQFPSSQIIYPEVCIDELCGFENRFVDVFISFDYTQ